MALNTKKVIEQLNRILECELAGVVRYTHYSMMIFGYSRIPIVKWFQDTHPTASPINPEGRTASSGERSRTTTCLQMALSDS